MQKFGSQIYLYIGTYKYINHIYHYICVISTWNDNDDEMLTDRVLDNPCIFGCCATLTMRSNEIASKQSHEINCHVEARLQARRLRVNCIVKEVARILLQMQSSQSALPRHWRSLKCMGQIQAIATAKHNQLDQILICNFSLLFL